MVGRTEIGGRLLRFNQPPEPWLDRIGVMPLPPYIHAPLTDPERYQTVYARIAGLAAAPTAGLHFTPRLLTALREKGVGWATVTLHIGLDTFRPVQEDDPRTHPMHREWYELPAATASAINAARAGGGRVIVVGTTTVRVLETVAQEQGLGDGRDTLQPASGWSQLFIYPGFRFRLTDSLITNFHLPRSTLLMLVSALVGRERLLAAYQEAVRETYRFYSFGDAMLILLGAAAARPPPAIMRPCFLPGRRRPRHGLLLAREPPRAASPVARPPASRGCCPSRRRSGGVGGRATRRAPRFADRVAGRAAVSARGLQWIRSRAAWGLPLDPRLRRPATAPGGPGRRHRAPHPVRRGAGSRGRCACSWMARMSIAA